MVSLRQHETPEEVGDTAELRVKRELHSKKSCSVIVELEGFRAPRDVREEHYG